MRLPRPQLTLRWMMILIAIPALGSWALSRGFRNAFGTVAKPVYYVAGWWDAEVELWEGNASLSSRGPLRMSDRCYLDRTTGLPLNWVGYLFDTCDTKRLDGHDDHILQYVEWNGLPVNSWMPWHNELFNLKRFFDKQSKTQKPELMIVGSNVFSPNRRQGLKLMDRFPTGGSPSEWLMLVPSSGEPTALEWDISRNDGPFYLLWEPETSKFAVIRTIVNDEEFYAAFDSATGRLLREETWRDADRLESDALMEEFQNGSSAP